MGRIGSKENGSNDFFDANDLSQSEHLKILLVSPKGEATDSMFVFYLTV